MQDTVTLVLSPADIQLAITALREKSWSLMERGKICVDNNYAETCFDEAHQYLAVADQLHLSLPD